MDQSKNQRDKRRTLPRTVAYFLKANNGGGRERANQIAMYCQSRHLKLVNVFSDDGALRHRAFEERPGASECLKAMRGYARATHVVFPNLKGTFVSVSEASRVLLRLRRYRKKVHFLKHPDKPFSTADSIEEGRAFWNTLAALGKLDNYGARSAWAESSGAHKVVGFIRGTTPYGYDRDGSLLIENPQEQKVIERIRSMVASGASFRDIAATLNSEGVPTKKLGSKWYPATVQRAASQPLRTNANELWRPEEWPVLAETIKSQYRRRGRGGWRRR